jgi:TPR repeat protein
MAGKTEADATAEILTEHRKMLAVVHEFLQCMTSKSNYKLTPEELMSMVGSMLVTFDDEVFKDMSLEAKLYAWRAYKHVSREVNQTTTLATSKKLAEGSA